MASRSQVAITAVYDGIGAQAAKAANAIWVHCATKKGVDNRSLSNDVHTHDRGIQLFAVAVKTSNGWLAFCQRNGP